MITFIDANANGISNKEIELLFSDKFIKQGGVEKRINEQILSGIIIKQNDNYYSTNFGATLVKIFDFIKLIFNL
jgi:F0F1-type ATP synthase delta subunit